MIVQKGEMFWPEADTAAKPAVLQGAVRDIPLFLRQVKGRDCIVQAGGNVGIYAIVLAAHFKKVVTVEPDFENYEALRVNVENHERASRIVHMRAALGEAAGRTSIEHLEADNCGAHRLTEGDDAPVVPIDALALDACDAIWLDIEGYELFALKGAQKTIDTFSPVIAIEDKGLSEHFGIAKGEAGAWLTAQGYRLVGLLGRDEIYTRGER